MKLFPGIFLFLLAGIIDSVLGACDVTFKVINADDDKLFRTLTSTDPDFVEYVGYRPCHVNIEASVKNCAVVGPVHIELSNAQSAVVASRDEWRAPYALFGNSGPDFFVATINAGTHSVRARVNGEWTPAYYFDLTYCCIDCNF
jgi:hypothetical protein